MAFSQIEQLNDQYPYPLAKRFAMLLPGRLTSFDCIISTRQIAHDLLQYLTLLLAADYLTHGGQHTFLPYHQPLDWQELLQNLLNKTDGPLAEAIGKIYHELKNSTIHCGLHESPLIKELLSDQQPIHWDKTVCYEIGINLMAACQPLLDFRLNLISGAHPGKVELLPLSGPNPDLRNMPMRPSDADASAMSPLVGHLILQWQNAWLDLHPFLIWGRFFQMRTLEVLLWDGEIVKDEIIYHGIFRTIVLSAADIGYREPKLRSDLPVGSDSTIRARMLNCNLQRYVARCSQIGRYYPEIWQLYEPLIADLNNFVMSKSANAALLLGASCSGRTSIVCHLAQEWQKRNHLVLVLETGDLAAKTFRNIMPLVPVAAHKRLICIVPHIEEHANWQQLFAYFQDFLQMYGCPDSGLKILLVCDREIFQAMWETNVCLLPFSMLYRPHCCASAQYPFIIEMPPISEATAAEFYRQQSQLCGYEPRHIFSELSANLKRLICQEPLWLKLLLESVQNWDFSPQISMDEILHNYLDQRIWEDPTIWRVIKSLLPLFANAYQLHLPKIEDRLAELGISMTDLQACQRKGILEIRRNAEKQELLSFTLPVVRDFLVANHCYHAADLWDLLQRGENVQNYHANAWAICFYWRRKAQQPEVGQISDKIGVANLLAHALELLQSITPDRGPTGQESKTIAICRALLPLKGIGVDALLSFLENLTQQQRQLPLFLWLQEQLDSQQQEMSHYQHKRFLQILTEHYQTADLAQACQIGLEWWNSLKDADDPFDKRLASRILAKIYQRRGQFASALTMAKHALAISEKDVEDLHSYEDLLCLAEICRLEQKFTEAQLYYHQLIELARQNKDFAQAIAGWHGLAAVVLELGHDQEALGYYDKIVTTCRENGSDQWQLAKAIYLKAQLLRKDQPDQALKEYATANEIFVAMGLHRQVAQIASEIAELQ